MDELNVSGNHMMRCGGGTPTSGVVRLRAIEPGDARMMFQAENESVQDGCSDYVAPLSMAQLEEYARGYDADPYRAGQLRLIAESDGEPVGIVDLYDISVCDRTGWAGIWIIPARRGRGYGEQALTALWRYAVRVLGLYGVGARIGAGNAVSRALFLRCGWRECGCMKGWRRNPEGVREDVVICQRLAGD